MRRQRKIHSKKVHTKRRADDEAIRMRPRAEVTRLLTKILPHLSEFAKLVFREASSIREPRVGLIALPNKAEARSIALGDGHTDEFRIRLEQTVVEFLEEDQREHRVIARDQMISRALHDVENELMWSMEIVWQSDHAPDVGGWDIAILVGVEESELSGVQAESGNLVSFINSLQYALASHIADRIKNEGTLEVSFSRHDEVAVVQREAGRQLMSKVAYVLSGNEWSAVYGNLFEAVNRIAMLRYEGAASSGALVFAKESDNTVKTRLKRNVPLTETVWARKMIEVSTPETAIVGSDESIYGIAPRSEVAHDHFWVEFLGERKWDLKFDDKVVMRSRLELATFRRSALRREDFERTLRRALGAIDIDVNVLLEIAEVVQEQHHGALMIISSDAVSEARRLAGYGTDISVTPFDPRIVRAVTRIDGAILLDPQGNCHAVGMILDGMAHGHGVPSRGARFNSAMKYVNASSVSSKQNAWIPPSRSKEVASSLALVVSEDGHVNLFPRLRPQISKTELDKLLELALSHPKPRTVPGSVREAAERLFVEYFDYVPDELWQRILPPMRPQPGSREDVRVPRPYDRHFSDVVVDGSGLPLSKPASSRESGAPARPPKRKAVSRTSKA